jgi:putative membrane protein
MDAKSTGFDVEPSVNNHFAWLRTLMSLQSTLMSAVRTSVSLIGFGFTVAQFFEKMRNQVPEGMREVPINVPRNLGLVLIAAGVISLIVFTWQYHRALAYLKSEEFAAIAGKGPSLRRPTYFIAWVVILIGIAAFGSVFARF